MRQRILVVGGGGIGGLLAAHLSTRPELAVSVVSRRPISRLSLTRQGETVVAPVQFLTDLDEFEGADGVIVATKAGDVAGVRRWLTAAASCGAWVGVAQNGIEQVERVAPYVDASQVFPMIVTYGAEREGPGRVVQTLDGVVRVPAVSPGRDFARISAGTDLRVELVDDLLSALWTKLAWNLVSNSLTTIADLAICDVPRREGLRLVAADLLDECVRVGHLAGATIDPAIFHDMMAGLASIAPDAHSSMWQDHQANRPLEHDAISGAVVRAADRFGIDVPACRTVTALLDALSRYNEHDHPDDTRGSRSA